MGEFPSGQRGQTVNLLAMPSVVRIHLPPPAIRQAKACLFAFFVDSKGGSWQQSGGLLQPPWLFRRKANPPSPTSKKTSESLSFCFFCGFERRLLATVRGTAATAVAFPQKSESTFPRQKSTGLDRDLSIFTYSLFISFAGLCLAFFVRIKYNVHIPTFESKERYS